MWFSWWLSCTIIAWHKALCKQHKRHERERDVSWQFTTSWHLNFKALDFFTHFFYILLHKRWKELISLKNYLPQWFIRSENMLTRTLNNFYSVDNCPLFFGNFATSFFLFLLVLTVALFNVFWHFFSINIYNRTFEKRFQRFNDNLQQCAVWSRSSLQGYIQCRRMKLKNQFK